MGSKTLVRIPNPVSNLDSIFTTFNALYAAYKSHTSFSLEDTVTIGVVRNLMSSKGHVGIEARARSYNEDSSRDSMFNQFKMYAEVFRLLGWIRSASDTDRTSYTITFFGTLVAEASDQQLLLEQSLLALAFPNNANNVLFRNIVFPFRDLLRTMRELGGVGTRDEFIVGPLSLSDSDDEEEFSGMLQRLRAIRSNKNRAARSEALKTAMKAVCASTNLKITTAQNYTRIPIAALKQCWTEITDEKIYSGNATVLRLTVRGVRTADWINSQTVYAPHYRNLTGCNLDELRAVSLFGFIDLLRRAQFDVTELEQLASLWKPVLRNVPGFREGSEILFNPYQNFSPTELDQILGKLLPESTQMGLSPDVAGDTILEPSLKPSMPRVRLTFTQSIRDDAPVSTSSTVERIGNLLAAGMSNREIVTKISEEFENTNQDVFYPVVVELFECIGVRCDKSRAGVTGLRWDAFIHHPFKIPIEIKSPGEERFIQVKAIRQALENKIILESRKTYGFTEPDTTSLVVGYKLPNERAEAGELIQNIRQVYGFNIGIIDFDSLLLMVLYKLRTGKILDSESFRVLCGVATVDEN